MDNTSASAEEDSAASPDSSFGDVELAAAATAFSADGAGDVSVIESSAPGSSSTTVAPASDGSTASAAVSMRVDEADSKTFFNSSKSLIVLRSMISNGSSQRSQSATLKADDAAPSDVAAAEAAVTGWAEDNAGDAEEAIAVEVRVEEAAQEKLVDMTEVGGRTFRPLSSVFG